MNNEVKFLEWVQNNAWSANGWTDEEMMEIHSRYVAENPPAPEPERNDGERALNVINGVIHDANVILQQREAARADLITAAGLVQAYAEYSMKNKRPPVSLDLQAKKFLTSITKKHG